MQIRAHSILFLIFRGLMNPQRVVFILFALVFLVHAQEVGADAEGNLVLSAASGKNIEVNGNLFGSSLVDGSIPGSKLAPNSVSSSHLASPSVRNVHIGDAEVFSRHLASQSVTTPKLAQFAVRNGNIGDGEVHSRNLGSSSVINSKIANRAVTRAKLTSGCDSGYTRVGTFCMSSLQSTMQLTSAFSFCHNTDTNVCSVEALFFADLLNIAVHGGTTYWTGTPTAPNGPSSAYHAYVYNSDAVTSVSIVSSYQFFCCYHL